MKSSSATPKDETIMKEEIKKQLDAKREGKAQLVADHLPPLPLVFTVLACSGALWILAMRDVLATGRIIAGEPDEAMLVCCNASLSTSGYSGIILSLEDRSREV